jgi:hypothetical protein
MTKHIQKPKEMDKQKRELLAKALRENLLRRKAWQRAQEEKKVPSKE